MLIIVVLRGLKGCLCFRGELSGCNDCRGPWSDPWNPCYKRLSNRGESSRDYNRLEKWQGSTILFYYFGWVTTKLIPQYANLFRRCLCSCIHPHSWQYDLLQNEISMLLVWVCCLCHGDVTILSCGIIVPMFVWNPILDFICDWFHIATFLSWLCRSSWCMLTDQYKVILLETIIESQQNKCTHSPLKIRKGINLFQLWIC